MFGADHEDLVAEPGVLAVGHLVETAPGCDQRHHERLSRSRGHLHGPAGVRLARWRHRDPDLAIGRRLSQEDDGLDGFLLAEEGPRVVEAALVVEPVPQKVTGQDRGAGVAILPPCAAPGLGCR